MSNVQRPGAPGDLLERIASDIRKSGFPLEVEVLNICSTKNTGRLPSVRYEYCDQLREIDLVAFYETISRENSRGPQHTITELIIECKKSVEKPWVFFSTPSYSFENVASFLKYSSEFDLYFSETRSLPLLARIYPKILRTHYADPALPRCVAYYEAFKGSGSPSEIYRAIDSVITYLNYSSERRAKRNERLGVFSEFYIPTIVIDGCLFEASVDKAKITVKERNHIQVRTLHRGELYIIDVVSRNEFQKFFARIEHLHKEITSAIAGLNLPPAFISAVRAKEQARVISPELAGELAMIEEDSKRRQEILQRSVKRKARKKSP